MVAGCRFCEYSPFPTVHCLSCFKEYFLQAPTLCALCDTSLFACLYCNSSSLCVACQDAYYLDSTSQQCEECGMAITGCELCSPLPAALQCLHCE